MWARDDKLPAGGASCRDLAVSATPWRRLASRCPYPRAATDVPAVSSFTVALHLSCAPEGPGRPANKSAQSAWRVPPCSMTRMLMGMPSLSPHNLTWCSLFAGQQSLDAWWDVGTDRAAPPDSMPNMMPAADAPVFRATAPGSAIQPAASSSAHAAAVLGAANLSGTAACGGVGIAVGIAAGQPKAETSVPVIDSSAGAAALDSQAGNSGAEAQADAGADAVNGDGGGGKARQGEPCQLRLVLRLQRVGAIDAAMALGVER